MAAEQITDRRGNTAHAHNILTLLTQSTAHIQMNLHFYNLKYNSFNIANIHVQEHALLISFPFCFLYKYIINLPPVYSG